MRRNEQLTAVISDICHHRLGKALNGLENFMLSHPHYPDRDVLAEIKDDYQLMVDYWVRGFNDPQRAVVYHQLLRRLYNLTANMMIQEQIVTNSYFQGIYLRPRQIRNDWTVSSVKKLLESFVADSVLLELEPKHTASEKSKALNLQHQNLMNDLFDYVLTSNIWSDALHDAFLELLLSPTVDAGDQQLLVSAISMSLQYVFDINKFKVLTSLYKQASTTSLRQRALVGWILALDEQKADIFPEMKQIVSDFCNDETCCQELTELQMQLYFCMDTDNDQRTIQNEIIPNLMHGNNLKISQHGLVETDEDTLEDILHPEESERSMEKMEQSMHRMSEMQKQGSDIYFGGFSQMKRFPFFQNSLSNWFAPFNPNHPDISQIWNDAKNSKFLHMIINMGGFCDSDRYSFVLAFEQVRNHLPANVVKMIDEGEAAPMPIGGQVDEEERKKPAFNRRMYLQNLYRFYRLHYMRREFPNPFEDQTKYLFFANELFVGTPLEKRMLEVVSFLMKRHRKDDAINVLCSINEEKNDTYDYHMLCAYLSIDPKKHFLRALELNPNNERALLGLAKEMFRKGSYEEAIDIYRQLLEINPEKKSYQLNKSVCLTNLHRYDEAEQILFRLNYENASDLNVARVLAWALTGNGKYEQAGRLYQQLMAEEKPADGDFLNYGFYLWLTGKINEAADYFRTYENNTQEQKNRWENVYELIRREENLLNKNGIIEEDIMMMFDLIGV